MAEVGAPQADFVWSARVRGFVGHNDNIQYYNNFLSASGKGGLVGGYSLDLVAEKLLRSGWSFGGAFQLDRLRFTGGDNDTYNHLTVRPSVFVKHRKTLVDGTDVTFQGTYSFSRTWAKDWDGIESRDHQFVARVDYDVVGPWAFYAAATLSLSDYDIFPGDPLSDRSGTFGEVKVGTSYDVNHPYLLRLSGYFGLQHNDADGANWRYHGWIVGGQADFHLIATVYGELGLSYASRDYDGDFTSQSFTPPGRENQQVTTLTGKLLWYHTPRHTFDLSLRHQVVDSNSSEFTGSQTAITGGLTIKLH